MKMDYTMCILYFYLQKVESNKQTCLIIIVILISTLLTGRQTASVQKIKKKTIQSVPVPVSVGAKLSFVEPGRRWAHSPSPSKAPGISYPYQGTMKTSVSMLKTSGGL